jgi:diaminopimelate decarboxylase
VIGNADRILSPRARGRVLELAETGRLPAYVFDLAELDTHLAGIRAALPDAVQLYYAAKANPAAPVLATVARHVDGIEVASGGELAHVRAVCPQAPIAFGGPGKTQAELEAALGAGIGVLHVEGVHELRLLAAEAQRLDTDLDVLLRVNPPIPFRGNGAGPALVMGGAPSPFGLDPDQADLSVAILRSAPRLRLRGVHAHLASGLDADEHLALSAGVLDWTAAWARRHRLELTTVTLGGGMNVDYADPENHFDWRAFGTGLAALAERWPGLELRIEPGRALTAYAGWYAAEVLDVRPSHQQWFAVLAGGTHHLRTPAARGHDQPFTVVATANWPHPWPRPELAAGPVTLVGALCTPRDVLARNQPVERLRAGDVVAFAMAGAYGWNISHHEFLMHPPPSFHYLD